MSILFKLKPTSAKINETSSVEFIVSGLLSNRRQRLYIENVTYNQKCSIKGYEDGYVDIEPGVNDISGSVDLLLPDYAESSVVSIYANVEQQNGEEWSVKDISAFAFQIESSSKSTSKDKISVYPPFVGPDDKAVIEIDTDPSIKIKVFINGRAFILRSDKNGKGSMHIMGIDLMSGMPFSAGSMQKFPISFSKSTDAYKSTYSSGGNVHYIPETMQVLQSTNQIESPECAILDSDPIPGRTLESIDDFCFSGSVVGDLSIFDSSSDYVNSRIGYCGPISEASIDPVLSDSICRIQNSLDTALLPNGTGLVAFSSAFNSTDPLDGAILSSRVYVAHTPSTLKFNGNPVRSGTILGPSEFYHSFTIDSAGTGFVGIIFRLSTGELSEIRFDYDDIANSGLDAVSELANDIENSSLLAENGIKVFVSSNTINVFSDTRFSIRAKTTGTATASVLLNNNKTLDVLVNNTDALDDDGSTIVFLDPKLGSQSYEVIDKAVPSVLKIEIPDGINNGIGPTITDTLYCQEFVIVGGTPSNEGISSINPLPYIKDIFSREVPSINPTIATVPNRANGTSYCYVVCQAPVNGVYQLFYYGISVGDEIDSDLDWTQITFEGENKNAKAECDNMGNLHIVWESDRNGGPSQIYCSVLGPGSRVISNQMLVSALEKERIQDDFNLSLISISNPLSLQTGWTRFLSNGGSVSVNGTGTVGIDGNPSADSAMAVFRLDSDQDGRDFDGLFSQLSYQLAFNITASSIGGSPFPKLLDSDIDRQFTDFKSQFSKSVNDQYSKDGNIFTLDKYDAVFDKIIPIAGSYKFGDFSSSSISGGSDARNVEHLGADEYVVSDEQSVVSNAGTNVNHFMVALMPEKVRFKASNIDPLFGYLDRNELEIDSSSTYIPQIEEIVYTGRYKMALILATSEDESTGDAANKKYHLLRQFGDAIDFDEIKNVKIAVHYSKANQDFIDGRIRSNPYISEQNSRFYGDIIVTVDNEVKLGESFVADFSDQYRAFDIGLGYPDGNSFVTQEQLPFNGNEYDDLSLLIKYENISVGPHSIQPNSAYINLSSHDRSTRQMVVTENISDILINGDFESNTLPEQSVVQLSTGDLSLSSWTVGNQVEVNYAPSLELGVVSLTGDYSVALTGLNDSSLGYIEQDITTVIGEDYILSFALSSNPNASAEFGEVTRKVLASSAAFSKTFSITNIENDIDPNWIIHTVEFTAVGTTTTLRLENVSDSESPFSDYGPIIDSVKVYRSSLLPNELFSQSAKNELLLSFEEYSLNYSLSTFGDMSKLPITISTSSQNRNPDISIDLLDKAHVAWQSNRNDYWDIYYSGMRDRSIPFRFETRITDSESTSIEPSISADKKGRRLIAWHDNRKGRYYQVFSALNKLDDPMYIDQCGIDEANEFIYQAEENVDPYDPYAIILDTLSCGIEFSFEPEISGTYYFVLDFYSDRERTSLIKSIDSRNSILGWKIDGNQMTALGAFALSSVSVPVTYTVSDDDGLGDSIYYVDIKYESVGSNDGDPTSYVDATQEDPAFGASIEVGDFEFDNVIFFKESLKKAGFNQSPENVSDIFETVSDDQSDGFSSPSSIIIGGNGILQGFDKDDIVASYYIQYDKIGSEEPTQKDFSITFEGPIVAIYVAPTTLDETNLTLGRRDVVYSQNNSRGTATSPDDSIVISEDRRTISGTFATARFNIDSMRVVVETLPEDSDTSGLIDAVYHCPFEQSKRCAVETDYYNDTQVDQEKMHFRVTFFADSEMNSAVFSSFSLFDVDNWIFGPSGYPASGVDVVSGETISIAFDPEVLPFEKFDDQGGEVENRTISSHFTFGSDNWSIQTSSGTSSALWLNDNSNGSLFHEDALPGDAWYVASPRFSGDIETLYGGRIDLSMRLDQDFSPSLGSQNLIIEIESSNGGTLRYTGSSRPDRGPLYSPFSVPLQSNTSWTHEPAGGGGFVASTETTMRSVIKDIETIRVSADFYSDADKSYLNSFSISPSNENSIPVFNKPLLCGVNYFYTIERFFEGAFNHVKDGSFLCPCFGTDANIWREDKDSINWLCSGQGFDDFRITQTDREAINANVVSSSNDLFYVSWEDYRFSRLSSDQPVISPDYFFGVYNANEDKFYSSAQGSYDRRMTYYEDETNGSLTLFDSSLFVDPFQNINIAFHDGSKVYHQGCSVGCAYEPFDPEMISPCMFTDGTDDSFYFVSTGPERDIEQYQKIRIRDEYVVYSTYLDIDTPISIINDCFIELDIIGVPGTYAYRLKNEDDDSFSEWMPIGPDLPVQAEDSDGASDERDFFRGYFIGKDRFIAPWIASSGNGTKRICCEVLTYFGKTERFCVDFQSIYKEIKYEIDFFFDESFESKVPSYNNYPILSTKETTTEITEEELRSIGEEVSSETSNTIYVRIKFEDVQKLELLERMRSLDRFSSFGEISFSVYQQGLNDQIGLSLTKQSNGVYSGSFTVEEDDSVLNVDGLGVILINIPGQCSPISFEDQNARLLKLLSPQNLDQNISILNNLDVFIDNYSDDDIRGSFGDPSYYKKNRFGIDSRGKEDIGETGGNNQWAGGGDGPLDNS